VGVPSTGANVTVDTDPSCGHVGWDGDRWRRPAGPTINQVTGTHRDPYTHTPEYKVTAVNLEVTRPVPVGSRTNRGSSIADLPAAGGASAIHPTDDQAEGL
jgi:hypothetical protein